MVAESRMPRDWDADCLGKLGGWLSGGTPSMANADYCSRRDVALARSLNVSIASFDDWIEATRAQLPEPPRAR